MHAHDLQEWPSTPRTETSDEARTELLLAGLSVRIDGSGLSESLSGHGLRIVEQTDVLLHALATAVEFELPAPAGERVESGNELLRSLLAPRRVFDLLDGENVDVERSDGAREPRNIRTGDLRLVAWLSVGKPADIPGADSDGFARAAGAGASGAALTKRLFASLA